jgi:AcrR family transcriptional regulator
VGRPAKFTLAQIQSAALTIVDRDGLAGLTMRSLATALETGPMTLYNYLNGRDGLEELVVDAVAAQVPVVAPTDDWAADVTATATVLWAAVRRHPATIPLVLTRRTSSGASLAPVEAMAAALARSGLDGFALLVAFRAVMGFVMGIAQAELAGPLSPQHDPRQAAQDMATIAGEANPTLARLTQVAGKDPEREFREGLNVVLAGLLNTLHPHQ